MEIGFVVSLLFFLSLFIYLFIYLFIPGFFWRPYCSLSFWVIDALQAVTVRYRSQAVGVYKRLRGPISIFLYPFFYSLHFLFELNREMLIAQN